MKKSNHLLPVPVTAISINQHSVSFLFWMFFCVLFTVALPATAQTYQYPTFAHSSGTTPGNLVTGTGTFANATAVPNFTWSISSTGNSIGSVYYNLGGTDEMTAANVWETKYGSVDASTTSLLLIRHNNQSLFYGDPLGIPFVTTLNFSASTLPSGWGFMILDDDVEQVVIRAKDPSGNYYSNAVISSWYKNTFDTYTTDGDTPPCWDGTNATLVGSSTAELYGCEFQDYVYGGLIDATGAAALFEPNAPVSSLEFVYYNMQMSATPSIRYVLAAARTVSVSGNIYNDTDAGTGSDNNTIDGVGTNANGGLYISAVQNGVVVSTLAVPSGGAYTLTNVPGGSNTLILTSTAQTIGAALSAAALPANCTSTAEKSGTGTGNDGAANSMLSITPNISNITNARFGIKELSSVGGTASSAQTICTGSSPANLTLSGHTGSVVKWQYSTDNFASSIVDIASSASATLTTAQMGTLTANRYYRAVVKYGAAAQANSTVVVIIIAALPVGGTPSPAQTMCTGSSPANLALSGHTGSVVKWQYSTDNFASSIVDIASSASSTLTTAQMGSLTANRYYRAQVRNNPCAVTYSSTVLITVMAASVGGTASSAQTICTGSSPANLTLSGHTGSVIKWQYSPNNFVSGIVDIASSASNTLTTAQMGTLTANRYYRAQVQNSPCALTYSSTVLITVTAASAGGTASSAQTICTGSSPANLTLSGNTGSVVKWQYSTDNFASSIVDIASSASTTLTTAQMGTLTANRYYRAQVQNSPCAVTYSSTVLITVNPAGQWIGGPSGNWNTPGNWCGGMPTSTTNVIIPAGSTVNIQSANAVANSINIANTASLVMTGTYNLSITTDGTFTNNGTFTATSSTGTVAFLGNGTISGTTTFKNIDTYGALNFGTASTVSGTFSIQPGGSVTVNGPSYTCPTAVLAYKTGGVFGRGPEWTFAASGKGFPANVYIQNNTTITFPGINFGWICYDLQIDNGSSLLHNVGGGTNDYPLVVGRNVTINGTLSLENVETGSLFIGGNWVRNNGGIFNHNGGSVTFEGTNNFSGNGLAVSTITAPASSAKDNKGGFGGEQFAELWMDKATPADSLVLLSNITVTKLLGFQKGSFDIRNSDVTLVSDANATARIWRVDTTIVSVKYNGTGRFVVQRFIQNPTATRSWRLLTAPLQPSTAPSINAAWQEGVVNPDRTNPNASGGIYNPWPGYGIHISGPGGVYSAANGYDHGTNSASILLANSGVTTWTAPVSTIATKITDQQGWMIFVRGDRSFTIGNQYVPAQNATLEPKGKINIGDVVLPVIAAKQIVGNPYASAISLLNVNFAGTAGKNSTYYMWDPKMFTSYTQPGKWVTFTGIGSSFVQTTSASPYPSNGTVESGQAFGVNITAAGNITFHESDKLQQSSLVGIANAVAARPMSGEPYALFRSDIYAKNDTVYRLTDGVLSIFNATYDNAANEADAEKLITFNTKESLSILRDTVKLAIEKRNDIQVYDTIFYSLSKFNELPYRFRFAASNFAPGMEAFLEDKFSNTRTQLSTTDTSVVDFGITADPLSKVEDRFRVVFKATFGNVLPVTFTNVKAYQQNKNIAVEWKVANELNMKNYEVHKSLDGVHFEKLINTASQGNYTGNHQYNWLDKHAAKGFNYYRIAGRGQNDVLQFSQVVKVNMERKGKVTIYPNPITDGIIKLGFEDMEKGAYPVRLLSADGQVMIKLTINHTGANNIYSISTGKAIAKGIYNLEVHKSGSEKLPVKVIIE